MLTETTRTDAVPETTAVDALEAPERSPRRRGRAATRKRSRVLTYVGLVFASCVAVFPLLFMVFSSFKEDHQIFADLGSLKAFLPTGHLSLDNYSGVFERVPAVRFITNSLIVTVAIVLLGLIVNSMIGFAISRMRWRGKNIVLSLVLATLMVPFETIAVPLVYWVAKLPSLQWVVDGFLVKQGMLNTYQVQILPFVANALSIFLFAQHFGDIPREIDEAARVDGAGAVRIYLNIILPLSRSAIAVLAVFTFLGFWNSYLWPLIVTVDYSTLGTLPVGLATFSTQQGTRWDLQIAAAVISMVPTTALVIALQKHLVKGIALAGLGGR